jgi:hypothetical protein
LLFSQVDIWINCDDAQKNKSFSLKIRSSYNVPLYVINVVNNPKILLKYGEKIKLVLRNYVLVSFFITSKEKFLDGALVK